MPCCWPAICQLLLIATLLSSATGCGGQGDDRVYDPVSSDIAILATDKNVANKRLASNRLASRSPMPETDVDRLLTIIQNEGEDEEVRCNVARSLRLNDDAIEKLRALSAKLPTGRVKSAVDQAVSR